jgi:hypothetical protein
MDMSELENYAALPGIDPYIDWALGPGRRQHFRPERLSNWLYVLIHLTGISARDFASGKGFTDGTNNARWRTAVHIPLLFIEDSSDDGTHDVICPAQVRQDFFVLLHQTERARGAVVHVSLSLPLESTLPIVPMPVTRLPPRRSR